MEIKQQNSPPSIPQSPIQIIEIDGKNKRKFWVLKMFQNINFVVDKMAPKGL